MHFINVKKTTCDFNNALVNAEINIKINKCYRIIVHYQFMLGKASLFI